MRESKNFIEADSAPVSVLNVQELMFRMLACFLKKIKHHFPSLRKSHFRQMATKVALVQMVLNYESDI